MNRPPVAWSMTVAALASTAGWRNVFDSTACPTHLPGTRWTSAAIAVSASKLGPWRSWEMSVRWSFIQTESNTSCSPMRAHAASSVGQSTACGEVLIPIGTAGSPVGASVTPATQVGRHPRPGRDRALRGRPDERRVLGQHAAG